MKYAIYNARGGVGRLPELPAPCPGAEILFTAHPYHYPEEDLNIWCVEVDDLAAFTRSLGISVIIKATTLVDLFGMGDMPAEFEGMPVLQIYDDYIE